ncbi:hypothetical protein M8J75_003725 [Diaphorina citri]|nr:hypothetical protein M8J75_003725 [Diaphorina citri]
MCVRYFCIRAKQNSISMVAEKASGVGTNPLEQFVLLAKTTKGAAAVELIKQVLEAPGIFMFKELIDMPLIKELETSPHAGYYHLLKLFAHGTYQDYLKQKEELKLPEMTQLQKKKLQNLTIVTLSLESKCIPYDKLLKELDISNVRDLEDLIIEAIYSDIIHGKLDQRNSSLELDFAIGRDINPGDVTNMITEFQAWSDSCANVLKAIETQIGKANSEKHQHLAHSNAIDMEILNIKKSLKNQTNQSQDTDDMMGSDNVVDKIGKKYKIKSNRGTSNTKFWQK